MKKRKTEAEKQELMELRKKILNKDNILLYLKKHNLTKKQFCKQCNISYSTFNRLMNYQGVKIGIIYKICINTNREIKLFNKL